MIEGVVNAFASEVKCGRLFPTWKRRISETYKFKKQLGTGGFATVWEVVRLSDEKSFACKV